ncbi:hypothetical protein HAHE_26960 [Haloferula helveola]|uniref:Sulfatase N-terminal domain-containing protein n=1 Tax=Haloferula helveola TaxID=490095 RepID=A0ABN6H9Z4_9BACT|nr:hypothetical protein HAHE_26960 [Haloferula helveola]
MLKHSLIAILLGVASSRAAVISPVNVTTTLGPDFFFDDAATGGNDNNTTQFVREISGYWTNGATVTLKGIGWASSASGTTATTATVTFTDPGPDDAFDTADDVEVGSVTDSLNYTGAGEYAWDFDADVVFVAASASLRIRIDSDGNIRRKTTGGSLQSAVKLSLAGSSVGGDPPPVVNAAEASGFWDTVAWDTGSGSVTGDLQDADTALVGNYRKITFRGVPSGETVETLILGNSVSETGQGTLVVDSGTLNVTGDATVGRADSANDSFIEVSGGTLSIAGNAAFGRDTEACDGSLTVAGGTVEVGGDLEMGGFETGGSMLRFHNPGSSAPVDVGGSLTFGRCSLDLTFDAGYTHTPGQVITLVEYVSRDGQFGNFRRGDEFNCGPNRYRIDYDVSSGGKLGITLTALANWSTASTPPNIVFIFSDDQGYSDLSLNGHPEWAAKYPMPELDAIAAAGARFTDAYVTGGVCHPSRCGILSGRYQQRFGTDNNLSGPSYNGLAVSQRTVPRRLQGLGYRTYGVGKWHLGDTVVHHPNVRGFDRWYGMWSGSRSYYANTTEPRVFQNQMTPDFAGETGDYLTDRIGDATVDFIDEHVLNHPGQPFYIYMSFTAVHGPMDIQAMDPRFARLQSEFGLNASDYDNAPIIFSGSNQNAVDANRYELAAMTLALDENIGKVVDKVDSLGLTDNTIFVYMTDNGGAGWSSGNGGNYSYNQPLRGYKGSGMTDGSIRVPCAMKWPGTIPAGQVVSDPVISLDFLATYVNAGGAPVAARNGLDGLDLLPLLKDGTPLPEDRVLTWRAGGNAGGGSAIRMGDWKLLISDGSQTESLYHLPSDPDESSNQIGSEPGIATELRARFDAWEAATLPPFYGTSGIDLDAGLERHGITGGYRLKNGGSGLAWLSSPFRTSVPLGGDFHFRFLARSSEPSVGADAELAYGLADSANRNQFIRAIVDFGQGEIRLENGRSGGSASAALAGVPTEFVEGGLEFDSSSNQLTFCFGGSNVVLALDGGYGPLSHVAVGAAGMEGEITTLTPVDGTGLGADARNVLPIPNGGLVDLAVLFGSLPPFTPLVERSGTLGGFAEDPEALVESLGGGLFRASCVATPGADREFFRWNLGVSR